LVYNYYKEVREKLDKQQKEKIKKEFQEFLKTKREERGLSVRGLAELAGISHTHLSQIETNKRGIPKPEILKKLVEPLGVDYKILMEKAGYINHETKQETIELVEMEAFEELVSTTKDIVYHAFTDNGIIKEDAANYFINAISESYPSLDKNETEDLVHDPNFIEKLFENQTTKEQIDFINLLVKDDIFRKWIESKNEVSIIKVPLLGYIAAGQPILADDHIEEWTEIPNLWNLKYGEVFVLRVKGDSMIGSRIFEGDKVVVKIQREVENGEIAVVNVNGDEATLKRVKKIDGQVILFPDNPRYEPTFIKNENARIVGKVIQVMFEP
jgi:SOS regulatory protein LexA